jgi:hypothetical protein
LIVLAFGLAAVLWVPLSISAEAPTVHQARDATLSPACKGKPAKVDDSGFVVIGGIEQWVTAKGGQLRQSCPSLYQWRPRQSS